jgi:hypothetical protein
VRVGVPIGVRLAVGVPVMSGRDGVEVDAGVGDGRLGLRAIPLRVIAR